MKDKYIVTTCTVCGGNARIYIHGEFSVGYCKKHVPDEHKDKIEGMGFEVKDL